MVKVVLKTGSFAHRGTTMQEARFVIQEIAPTERWLRDYSNDPAVTFTDLQTFF
jgi:hypothetical protein